MVFHDTLCVLPNLKELKVKKSNAEILSQMIQSKSISKHLSKDLRLYIIKHSRGNLQSHWNINKSEKHQKSIPW